MQGPSMRPCKFENKPIFSKDMSPKFGYIVFPALKECRERSMILVRTCEAVRARVIEICCAHDAQFTQNNGERDNGDQSRLRAVNGAAI